jgi:V/A-type H+-transporting ATPase subunit D
VTAASRSRWLELVRRRSAARQGRALLDQKREALVRELLRRRQPLEQARRRAEESLATARERQRVAEIELGRDTVASAALAQPPSGELRLLETRSLGVLLRLAEVPRAAVMPAYAPGGTAASLDAAVAAYGTAVSALLALSREEEAQRAFRRALARTNRRWNALDRIVLPEIERELRVVAAAVEEEERDEAFRRRRLGARRGGPNP